MTLYGIRHFHGNTHQPVQPVLTDNYANAQIVSEVLLPVTPAANRILLMFPCCLPGPQPGNIPACSRRLDLNRIIPFYCCTGTCSTETSILVNVVVVGRGLSCFNEAIDELNDWPKSVNLVRAVAGDRYSFPGRPGHLWGCTPTTAQGTCFRLIQRGQPGRGRSRLCSEVSRKEPLDVK